MRFVWCFSTLYRNTVYYVVIGDASDSNNNSHINTPSVWNRIYKFSKVTKVIVLGQDFLFSIFGAKMLSILVKQSIHKHSPIIRYK